ncbi:hypothetical protein L596_027537 [Steinernema carpocapsae]|uniref:Uncharacterized protein n=1 Tax=Steinernema carpocapsae TaxID=34508 RepID=A0A4U5LVT6_STECR|nr:hypothetical protein L596_027537 [Steinernema carpocapsae]
MQIILSIARNGSHPLQIYENSITENLLVSGNCFLKQAKVSFSGYQFLRLSRVEEVTLIPHDLKLSKRRMNEELIG